MSVNFDNVDPTNTGRGGEPANEGKYSELALLSTETYVGKQDNITYFKAEFEVLHAENGYKPGAQITWLESIDGPTKYPSYHEEAKARILKFCGHLAGIANKEEMRGKVSGKDVGLLLSPSQPFTGSIVSAVVKHKITKSGATIAKFEHGAVVNADGTPKTVNAVTQVKAVVPPPPATAPAAFPPAGWAAHPTAPGWFFKGQEVVSEADLRAKAG